MVEYNTQGFESDLFNVSDSEYERLEKLNFLAQKVHCYLLKKGMNFVGASGQDHIYHSNKAIAELGVHYDGNKEVHLTISSLEKSFIDETEKDFPELKKSTLYELRKKTKFPPQVCPKCIVNAENE